MKKVSGLLAGFLLLFITSAGYTQNVPEKQEAAVNVSLQNGFYLILEEQSDLAKFEKTPEDEVVVTYTLDHLGVTDQPTRHYRVKNRPDVGFSSEAQTEVGDKVEGKTTLNVVLGEGNAREFQQFTAANIDRSVSIIIAGKVVTAHKIRTEIIGGKIQITRCGDQGG